MVEGLFDLYRLEVERKGLTLVAKVPLDLLIRADKNMLEAILRNLVGNAVKFTPRRGTVTIAAERAEKGGGVRVTVADTGIGMSSAMVVALLQRGTIRQRRGTEGEPGTGLGLGLCGRLVDRHGGILSIDSAEGNGSAFSILFPDGGSTDVDRP